MHAELRDKRSEDERSTKVIEIQRRVKKRRNPYNTKNIAK